MPVPQDSDTSHATGPALTSPSLLRRIFRILLLAALALYFGVAAALLGLRYFVLPHIDRFRPRIEALVAQHFHTQLSIGQLAPHWRGLEPGVEFTDLRIRGSDGQAALNVPHATASLSWSSLLSLSPMLSSLVVDHPDVLVERHADGSLSVGGIAMPTAQSGDPTFATWLLGQGEIDLNQGTLRWRDDQRHAPELVLSGLQARMLNHGLLHQFALRAPTGAPLFGGPLDFRARFRHTPFFTMGQPSHWTGTAWLSTGAVSLPTLGRYVDIHLDANAGTIANQAWINFGGGHIHTAHGELLAEGLALRTQDQPRLDIPSAHTGWQLALDAHHNYQLHLSDFHMDLAQAPLADGTRLLRTLSLSNLTARYRLPEIDHGQLLSVAGDRVDLGLLGDFLRGLPLPATFRNELDLYDPHGILENYVIEAERAKPANAAAVATERVEGAAPIIHYRLAGDLHGLSLKAQAPPPGLTPSGHTHTGLPGVENLWGHVDADETHGTLALDTVDAAVTVNGLFDQPRIALDRLLAQANWTLKPAAAPGQTPLIDLSVTQLHVENSDAAIDTTLHYSNAGRGSIDLKSTLTRGLVASVPRYLPVGVRQPIRDYLAHALQAGQIKPGATIVARGPLDAFPYSHDPSAGLFQIEAPFTGGRFEPTPQPPQRLTDGSLAIWPALGDIDGVFEIKNQLLRFDIARASYLHTTLAPVTGQIADMGQAGEPLVIHGVSQGPLPDLVDYADHSPLGVKSNHLGASLQTDGPASLDLTLTFVPRAPVALGGKLAFAGDSIAHEGWPPLAGLRGAVRFTRSTLDLDQLNGQLLGGDIQAHGGIAADGRYTFGIDGRIAPGDAGPLAQQGVLGALLAHTSGSTPYTLQLTGSRTSGMHLDVQSNLDGLALDFPAPLNKTAAATLPFALTLAPAAAGGPVHDDTRLDLATLRLGPLAADYLLAVKPGAAPSALRGAIAVHDGSVPALPAQGVQASLALPTLDFDAWRSFAANLRVPAPATPAASGPSTASSLAPTHVAATVDTLTLAGRPWHQVRLDATHGGTQWQAHLDAQEAAGTLTWTPPGAQGAGLVTARLARLELPARAASDTGAAAPVRAASGANANLAANPHSTLPALDLEADQVSVAGRQLGRLEVRAHNTFAGSTPVWQLDRLQLANPDATLSATGNWRIPASDNSDLSDAARHTALDFTLAITDAGKLLERAGLPQTVKGGHGSWTGQVDWHGGPSSPDYATLNGKTSLKLQDGHILKVDPGAAKLLGVLSLQSLVHFLSLDFRNLTSTDLAFQTIQGEGAIDAGKLKLGDATIDATPAHVALTGSVDLGNETQDLHARVTPHLGAGTAALATAAINPLLGLGMLVADVALSQTLSHLFAVNYTITGSWAHPMIKRVGVDQSKIGLPHITPGVSGP